MHKLLTVLFFLVYSVVLTAGNSEDILERVKSIDGYTILQNSCPSDLYNGKNIEYSDQIIWCSKNRYSCLQKCSDGSANHCFGLANVFQSEQVEDRYSDVLYSNACQNGLLSGCTNRAASLMRYKQKEKATCYARTFQLTCKGDDAWGCTMYGLILSKGMGVKQNTNLALKVLKKGCKQGLEDACQYAQKIEKDIKRNKK